MIGIFMFIQSENNPIHGPAANIALLQPIVPLFVFTPSNFAPNVFIPITSPCFINTPRFSQAWAKANESLYGSTSATPSVYTAPETFGEMEGTKSRASSPYIHSTE